MIFEIYYIFNGAHLASATVPWHWLFFCPAPKFCTHFGRPVTKSLKSPKWHWLILVQMDALVHVINILRYFISFYYLALVDLVSLVPLIIMYIIFIDYIGIYAPYVLMYLLPIDLQKGQVFPQICRTHIVMAILTALTGFPNLTGFLNEFESLIVN